MEAKKTRTIMLIIVISIIALAIMGILLGVFLGGKEGSSDNFEFSVVSGKAIINKYIGKDTELIIPSSLKGKKVAGFAENTFSNSTVVKLEFAKKYSGQVISKNSFKDAKNLKTVILPTSIKTLEEGAFENCTSLRSVVFGENLETIGVRAFYGCYALSNNTPDDLEKNIFTLPNSTISLNESAFYKCTNLEEVNVGDNLTTIGESVFEGCTRLVRLGVSDKNNVQVIGKSAFNGSNLKSKKNAVGASTNSELNFPKLTSIGEKAFFALKGSSNFEYFKLSSTVKNIGDYAFANNISLKEVVFGKDILLTSFGVGVFSDLTYLENVSVEGDSEDALKSNHLPSNITNIPSLTFSGSFRLLKGKSFEIGKSVATIGEGAFSIYNCSDKSTTSRTLYTTQQLTVNADNATFMIKNLPNYFKTNDGDTSYSHYLLMEKQGKIVAYIGGFVATDCLNNKDDDTSSEFNFLDTQGIRDTVTGIGGYAFAGVQFKRLVMPTQTNYIGNFAFANGLIDCVVANGKNCTTVEKDAFKNVVSTPTSLFLILVNDPDWINGSLYDQINKNADYKNTVEVNIYA